LQQQAGKFARRSLSQIERKERATAAAACLLGWQSRLKVIISSATIRTPAVKQTGNN